jgi:RNA polymerase sigma-70 factor (ECF subfamily)
MSEMPAGCVPLAKATEPPVRAGPLAGQAEPSDESLMLAYRAGDGSAFEELFERYAALILRLGRRHLGSDDAAQELLQQSFLRLHGARHDYQPSSRLHPWLMTIVMNGVRDQWRLRRRRPTATLEHEPAAPRCDPENGLAQQDDARGLHAALACLPRGQREVVELHWFQEHSFAEVARILGTSEGGARVKAHRAYARLKQLLAGAKSVER